VVIVSILACWVAVPPGTAGADQGDVTRIGGQGLDSKCRDDSSSQEAVQGDSGAAPIGSAVFNWNSFGNARTVAVGVNNSGTQVFVADRSVVRGVNGNVAGVPRQPPSSTTSSTLYKGPPGLTGKDAEGADAKAVALSAVGVAVDAKAETLYVLERDSVRQVNLREQVPTIRSVAGAAVGTSLSVETGSVIAADTFGRVFVGDSRASGTIYRLDVNTMSLSPLTTLKGSPGGVVSLSVDAGGTALYAAVSGSNTVVRVDPVTGGKTVVAGGGTSYQEGVAATSVALSSKLAVAVDPLNKHLFISDGGNHQIRKVDLSTGVINTVLGSGQAGYQDSGKAASFALNVPTALAVTLFGDVYMLVPDDCAIFKAEMPAIIFTAPPPSNPPTPQPPPTTPATPTGQDSTNTGSHPATETAGTPNPGGAPQQGAAPANQTHIVSSDNGATAAQPQTEIRIVDPGNAVTAPQQGGQLTVQPVPSSGSAAQFTPSPSPVPGPAPTSATDAGTVTLADPGTSAAGVAADAPAAVPAAPSVAPVPPPAPSAPPHAAPQPVSNVGLAHGDAAQPVRGATRYAMVRNDEDQTSGAAMAMAGAGALVAIFLCVMFVAPGASSKPKPRPRRA
jgi:hypothetical protein